MRIYTPNPNGEQPIVKEIVVGSGVVFKINGYRYSFEGEVLEIREITAEVLVRGVGFEDWISLAAIKDARTPQEQIFQSITDHNALP